MGELAEIVRGASPRPISDPKWFDANSDVGWLRISDVTNQNGRIRYLEQHISKLGQEKTRVITEPHLLLSIAATVGKPLINYVKTGVHDGFLIFLNPKFDLEFMYQWLEMFRPEWNKYGQPGSQVNLNSDLVKNQKIAIPSKEEQQKISNFFNEMDSLIALHQRKLDKLKRVKSAYLTEMFPAEGEREPKRRFPGFTGAWEQRKLGDMGNVITGNTPSTKDKSNWTTDKNKGHIWITPTDINRKVLFDSERYLSDKGWLKARKIPKNSVLITSIASIGKNAINGIDAAFNQQINALILQNNNYYFVLSLMDKEKKRFEALAGQTATPIINKSTFSSFQLQIPSENEQNKIGNFFKKIDNLITLHQRKLDKLQKLKNAYLNEMFV